MTFYFVKNTWKIKMKALPGFANNHQNPWSHKGSVFIRCFLSPAPFSMNSLIVEWPTRVLRKKKLHFEPILEIIQDWFSAGAATLHLNKGTKFPLGICISISPNLVFSGRDQSYLGGKAELSPALPAETRGTEVTANKSNGLEPCGNTNLWDQHLRSLLQTQALPGTPDVERRRHKLRWQNVPCPPVGQKMYPWNWDFRIHVSKGIKQHPLQRASPKKHRSTCWMLKICTEINNNRMFHGAFHFLFFFFCW